MFFKRVHKRIKIIFCIIAFLFVLIIGKVFYIQVIDYNKLSKYASNLWGRNLPIEANRGLITDRNGVVLADNLTTSSLVFIPNQIEDKEKTAKLIAEILEVDEQEIYKHVTKKQVLKEFILKEEDSLMKLPIKLTI